MAERVKLRRVFQVAKELKVVTPTIIEFLESSGFDVSRKQMAPVTEEMYLELLQKYDIVMYRELHEERSVSQEEDTKLDAERLRKEELDKIFAAKPTADPSIQQKIELPKYQKLIIEQAKAKEKKLQQDHLAEAGDKIPVSKTDRKIDKLAKEKIEEDEADISAVKKPGLVVTADGEQKTVKSLEEAAKERADDIETGKEGIRRRDEGVQPEKGQDRRKIELPRGKALTIVAKAPEPKVKLKKDSVEAEEKKKPPRKRLRRKKIAAQDETVPKAAGTDVESKLRKATEKLEKQRAQTKRPTFTRSGPPGRKRKRKSKSGVSAGAQVDGKGKRRKRVDEKEVAATIKQTFAQLSGAGKSKRRHSRSAEKDADVSEQSVLKVTEFVTTQELANLLELPVQELIVHGLEMGMIISINQRLDKDAIELLTSEFNTDVEFVYEEDIEQLEELLTGENNIKRQPVVTIMGHVDHGKTTLLDYLRRTNVAESEAGGITQHIGAYEISHNDQKITFLDTPGHEAFTAMRARGAQVTDIVVLIVAADDSVMPQTLEAIDHAKVAGVPIIIAVNKVDKPDLDLDAIYKQLADNHILVEKWGGSYQAAEISAKFGQGVDELLEEIFVAADMLELKADPAARVRGGVIESRLDKGLGAVATILIQNGTLKIGTSFVIGQYFGKVRAMYDEFGTPKTEAGPGTPVQVVGFDGIPQAGDRLLEFESEKEAREVSQKRQRQYREISLRHIKALTLDQLNRQMQEMEIRELALIIKGDVHGSVEVLSDALMRLSTSEVKVEIIHRGVGGITESDVLLAAASNAIIIGFHVHPNPQARETARKEGVEYRLYRIIHEVVDEIRKSLEGLLAPTREEQLTGSVEVRQVFKISRVGTVAGCRVTEGKINRKSKVRLIRDDVEIWSGELDSLKRFKDDTREVLSGFECGLSLKGFNDIRLNDRVEAFEIIEIARKLEEIA